MQTSFEPRALSRRDFVRKSLLAASVSALCGPRLLSSAAQTATCPPVVVFSKIYQELKLDYADAAALTAEAGLDGVDCPVRAGGEVLPERVADDLPRYVEALRRHGLKMPLLTTEILSPASPHAEQIVKTGKKLGADYYRLGYINRKKDVSASDQIRQFRTQLTDLAAMNREIGMGALVQNHSPAGRSTYLAGDLSRMRQLLERFDPAQIGAAFDIGHALIVYGDRWRTQFEPLKPHLRIAYIKDAARQGRWTRFGEGEIGRSGYFKLLKQMGYNAPFSLHIEFDWDDKGKSHNRATLLNTLKESATVLRRWFADA